VAPRPPGIVWSSSKNSSRSMLSKIVQALLLALVCGVQAASSMPVTYGFTASLDTGPLQGTDFSGTFAFDPTESTGIGQEFLSLTAFDFSLLGSHFTRADIDQGGQAILENGHLSYFTAALFPLSPPAPVSDIAFGFGGPGIIGYATPAGFGTFGSGHYAISVSQIPEPSTLVLLALGAVAVSLRDRARRCAIRSDSGSMTAHLASLSNRGEFTSFD